MQRRAFLGFMASGTLLAADAIKQKEEQHVWIKERQIGTFLSTCEKIEKVKRIVGYGNFNILSFDHLLIYAARYSQVGAFSKKEKDLMEEMFYEDPRKYGFYGKRTAPSITTTIAEKEVVKIPHTGHYLFKGHSQKYFDRVINDVGSSLVLTSGVRSVVKQMNLYFNKIKSTRGNISLASRSLAPPAFSYHSIGDFDVGKKGWGHKNFTASFARTEEFWKLRRLPYISIRYTLGNKDGVRFEPWHVEII